MTGPDRATLDRVEAAVAELRAGRPVVVIDDAAREDEGDLIFAAESATPELVSFVIRHTSGFLCVSVSDADADRLDLPPMHRVNRDRHETAYAVSVDARDGVTTGISASDRATTLRVLADPATTAADLTRPGHVVPLRAKRGGVLRRAGHTEAAMDLMTIAGLRPVAGLCEIVSTQKPTQMAREPELRDFCAEHDLLLLAIADLMDYRLRTERVIAARVDAPLPLEEGAFTAVVYHTTLDAREHVALVHGDVGTGDDVLVRIQQECLFADVFGSVECTCRREFDAALQTVGRAGRGVVVYLRRTEDSVGPAPGEHDAAVPHRIVPSVDPADAQVCGQILTDLGVRSLRLLHKPGSGWAEPLERHGPRVSLEEPLRVSTHRWSRPAARRTGAGRSG